MINLLFHKYQPKYLEKKTPGWIGHLPLAYWVVSETKPRVLVELGTHLGNSYFTFCQSVKENKLKTSCYAVDCWEGDVQAGQYEQAVYTTVQNYNDANYRQFSKLLKMRFDEALHEIPDGTVDLLHIDGLHTYEAVRHDYETWLPKLSANGLVMFHDIAVEREDFGVKKFWGELKKQYPCSLEFDHNHGMGVIFPHNGKCGYGFMKRGSLSQQMVLRVLSKRGIALAVANKTKK
jgi:hypothetical protein